MSSKSLNKVTLIGNVTRDPELRYTPQGNAVCTFGLATNRSWKTDSGEIREEAEFHRLVAWNKLAELCSQLCTKGRKIYVEGRLQTRTFTGSDNAQHTMTEIVIDDMILLDSKFAGSAPAGAGSGGYQQRPAAPAQPQEETGAMEPEMAAQEEAPAASEDDGEKKPAKKSKTKAKKTEEAAETSGPAPAPVADEKVNLDDIPF